MANDVITVTGLRVFEEDDGAEAICIQVTEEDLGALRNLDLGAKYRLVRVEDEAPSDSDSNND